jgi:hypothetical protein
MRLLVKVWPPDDQKARLGKRKRDEAAPVQFAIPVKSDEVFERVWQRIEERYKRNYISPEEAQ